MRWRFLSIYAFYFGFVLVQMCDFGNRYSFDNKIKKSPEGRSEMMVSILNNLSIRPFFTCLSTKLRPRKQTWWYTAHLYVCFNRIMYFTIKALFADEGYLLRAICFIESSLKFFPRRISWLRLFYFAIRRSRSSSAAEIPWRLLCT